MHVAQVRSSYHEGGLPNELSDDRVEKTGIPETIVQQILPNDLNKQRFVQCLCSMRLPPNNVTSELHTYTACRTHVRSVLYTRT